jgi:hypothetical protein
MRRVFRTRREFLRSSSVAALGAGCFISLSGCKGEEKDAKAGGVAAPACDDAAALSEDARSARESVEYVSVTAIPAERCDNCEFWVPPEPGAECGGCSVLEGPIAAAGWCNLWVAAG